MISYKRSHVNAASRNLVLMETVDCGTDPGEAEVGPDLLFQGPCSSA